MTTNKYKIDILIKELSFFEAQEIYDLILDHIKEKKQKDSCIVTIIDPSNGKHLVTDNIGVNPFGEVCDNCISYDCSKCSKYKMRPEDESISK